MAVQMATSSAQDFTNFSLGTETKSSPQTQGRQSFEEALASAAHSERKPGSEASQKGRTPDDLAARKARHAMSDPESASTEETASSPDSHSHFRAMAAHYRQAHPEVGKEVIDAMLALRLSQTVIDKAKTARFNPDMILAERGPIKWICCEAEKIKKAEEEEEEEEAAPPLFVSELLGEVLPQDTPSGGVGPEGEAALPETEAELLAALSEETEPGGLAEGSVKNAAEGEPAPGQFLTADAIAQGGEAASAGEAEGKAAPVTAEQAAAQSERTPELPLPEAAAQSGEAAASAEEAGETAEGAAGGKPAERPGDARSLEELLAQYKEEREAQSERERGGGTSDFSRQNAQKEPNASTAKRQSVEPSANLQKDTGADAPREVPIAPSAGMNFRDALDAFEAPAAAPSPSFARAGAAYPLEQTSAFSDGVNTVLEFMRTDGTSEARIVVEPPALGHIDVSLRATSAGMEATFRVENEHLKQMLQQQMDVLKSSLQLQGIHVSSLAVDIRNRDDQRGREAAYGTGKRSRHVGGADGIDEGMDEGASLVRLDLEKGLLHWVG